MWEWESIHCTLQHEYVLYLYSTDTVHNGIRMYSTVQCSSLPQQCAYVWAAQRRRFEHVKDSALYQLLSIERVRDHTANDARVVRKHLPDAESYAARSTIKAALEVVVAGEQLVVAVPDNVRRMRVRRNG